MITSNLDLISAAVGFLLPLALAAVQREHWRTQIKAAVTFAVALAAATITTYVAGAFDAGNWTTSALVILVTALSTYEGFYKPTGIAAAIAAKLRVAAPAGSGS